MRKVFALLAVAAVMSVASCGGSKTEGTGDSAAVDTAAALVPVDTTPAIVDSAAAIVDSAASVVK